MKASFDKWLVMDGAEYKSYVLYNDISAFQKDKQRPSIRIFLRGNVNPFVFNFSTTTAMNEALEEIVKQLSVEPNK